MTERALMRNQVAVAENREQLKYTFQAKVDGIRSELYNFAYRLTGNREDAEDLLQESYFKAFKYFHQLRDRDKFKEWIFQITANQFRNSLKKKKREQLYFTDDYEKIGAMPQKKKYNPDVVAEKDDRAIRLHQAIASLDPKMREALVLFEL
ncbi:MAG TPA: RNA polymerase sigma factor, partial [bacterium]|nr:RNA polymerase sigma factor [bacterium]